MLYFAGEPVLLRQRYILVRAAGGEVSLDGPDALERAAYRDHRWWSLAELESSPEAFFPGILPEIIRRAQAMR